MPVATLKAVIEDQDQERPPDRHPSKIVSVVSTFTLTAGMMVAVPEITQSPDHARMASLYSSEARGRVPWTGYSDSPDDSSPFAFSQLPGAEYANIGSISVSHDGPYPSGLYPSGGL